MVSLTCYGGGNEIGGNKILLEDGKCRLLFDFGMSFKTAFKYFDEFMQPRPLNGLGDWFELGLLPQVKGIYRQDYRGQMGLAEEPLDCQGVFLSHAHADHASYVHHLRPDLPIYGTPATLKIMESVQETAANTPLELTVFKKNFEFVPNKKGDGVRRIKGEERETPRVLRQLKGKVEVGDFEVEPVPVNHSLHGASGFIVDTPAGKVAYTGDLRFHGYGGHLTENFVKRAKGAKWLIMEGTRIDSEGTMKEEEVCSQITDMVGDCKKIVLVNWPLRDTDRLWSVYNAAKKNDRKLVISTKQAYLLDKLAEIGADVPSTNDERIRIFLTRKSWGLLGREGIPPELLAGNYKGWELQYLEHKNVVTYKDLQGSPSEYVLRCDFFDMTELIDIRPPEGSRYIHSVVEPFSDEMFIDREKVDNWLKHFGLYPGITTHCSGHAPGPDLRRIAKEIAPEHLIPVHTEHPEMFKGLAENVAFPEVGKKMVL